MRADPNPSRSRLSPASPEQLFLMFLWGGGRSRPDELQRVQRHQSLLPSIGSQQPLWHLCSLPDVGMFVRSHVGAELHRSKALRTGPRSPDFLLRLVQLLTRILKLTPRALSPGTAGDRGSSCGGRKEKKKKSDLQRGQAARPSRAELQTENTLQKIHTLPLHFASFPEVALRLPPLLSHHIFSLCPQTRRK